MLWYQIYLSPEAGSSFRWSPRGPLWLSLCFIFWNFSPPTEKSFILTEGRKEGRTDGSFWGQKNQLFGNISKTTKYFSLIVSGPHRRGLKTSSGSFRIGKIGNFSNKKISSNLLFYQISRHFEDQKISFLEISQKPLDIFSWLLLLPTEDSLRHLLEVSELEKSEIFPIKKFRTLFFEKAEKTCFSEISQKLLNIFSWLFLVPTEKFWRHLEELSKLENRKFFQ